MTKQEQLTLFENQNKDFDYERKNLDPLPKNRSVILICVDGGNIHHMEQVGGNFTADLVNSMISDKEKKEKLEIEKETQYLADPVGTDVYSISKEGLKLILGSFEYIDSIDSILYLINSNKNWWKLIVQQ